MLMLREKDLTPRALFELALPLRALCSARQALFLVNGSLEVALAVAADGVHLGYDALPIRQARKLISHQMILGVSAHSSQELEWAVQEGADYATLSPLFVPNSKSDLRSPLGLAAFSRLTAATDLPILALGGVEPARLAACLQAGAVGVAAIGSFFTTDPFQAASCMRRAANEM